MNRFLISIILVLTLSAPAQAQVEIRRSKQTVSRNDQTFYLHAVKRGQTLYSIAKAYDVTPEAIIEFNPFAAESIKPRQSLIIPGPEAFKAWKTEQKTAEQPSQTEQPEEEQDVDIGPEEETPDETLIPPPGKTIKQQEELPGGPAAYPDGTIKPVDSNSPINVTLMLPFKTTNISSNYNFSNFYRGVLIALNSLKAEGISVNFNLLSTEGSESRVAEIINSGVLDNANLIIGPVYPEQFEPVARYAAEQRIPIVSPLVSMPGKENSYVYEVTPDKSAKYDKLEPILRSPDNNVFIINIANTDWEALEDMQKAIPYGIPTVEATKTAITAMLNHEKENIILLPASDQTQVDNVLARIASINSSIGNVSQRYRITVIGTPLWSRFINNSSDIALDKYFQLNATYVTSYQTDRSNPLVFEFYRQYIEAFNDIPSLLSFRGYDVTRFFITALNEYNQNFPQQISNHNPEMLQVKYNFTQNGSGDKFINREWMVVKLLDNYSIEIE